MNEPIRRHRRMLRSAAALAGAALAASLVAVATPAVALDGQPTIVSLTFDDSNADQMAAVEIMNANGLDGTFYALSGFIGAPGYQTQADLTAIAAAGHEIGGHTVTHPDMATLDTSEAMRQACENRATLTSWGFQVTSFAYPFASVSETAKSAVEACGYNSARNLGDIETRFGCAGCGFAEQLPPADPFELRVPDQVESTWTLADLQAAVTNAENSTGGWVGLTFHHICDNCDVEGLNVTPAVFDAFAQWLAARPTTHNTSVQTVHQVIGGSVKPIVTAPLPPAVGPGVNAITNPGLEAVGTDGVPQCWITAGFGTNAPTFSTVSPGRTGSVAEQLVMSNYVDGDAKLIFTMDFGSCAPTVTTGHRYSLRAWYKADTVTQFAVYLRNSIGAWEYWTSSPYFAASSTFTQAVWDSDVIPAGYTGISFGLNLFGNGTLVTDDYAMYDLVGAPGPSPSVARLAGADRYGTAVAISQTYSPGVPRVFVATGTEFADALSAAPAAAKVASPLLLTRPTSLPAAVRNEIVRLAPAEIVVVGGTGAISESVVTSLAAIAPTIRVAGADRYATSRAIAAEAFAGGAGTAFLATGSNFPDALSAAPAASRFGGPTILVQGSASGLDDATRTILGSLGVTTVKLAGGTSVVSTSIEADAATVAGVTTVQRLAGPDRYATAAVVNADAFTSAPTSYLAVGTGFADALVGAALAGWKGGPLFLTPTACLSTHAAAGIGNVGSSNVVLFGGTAVLGPNVENLVPCA